MDSATSYVRGIIPDAINREKDDFYPTPPAGTRALLSVETFEGKIWEPACGDGALSNVLLDAGYEVTSTDLIDRCYGEHGVDFLMEAQPRAPNIITNPPFKHADEFALKALSLTTGKVALLCRLSWLEGKKRRQMFESTPLARVWVFAGRLNMQRGRQPHKGESSGMIAFAWFVWEHGHKGPATLGWVTPQ
jgi:hypothetical protein